MFNITLFKKEIKSNYKVFFIFLGLVTMYSLVIVVMFDPALGESLDLMAKSMPEIFKAFGMANVGSTLIEFLANYLYGFILVAIPCICITILANRLVARYVDNGSMSYLLAAPHTRREIVTTQAITLFIATAFMVLWSTLIIITISAMSFPGTLDIVKLCILNIGLLAVLAFMSSICFLGSCIFNDTRKANGLGGAVIIVSILLQMIGQVGNTFEFLKYFTPLTLFDVNGIINGNSNAYMLIAILYIVAFIIYSIAIYIFCRKDLPI